MLIGLSASILFSAFPTQAFSISPLKYVVTVASGENQDLVVSVKNDSDEKKEFVASVMGVGQDLAGRPIFKKNIDVAENWIKAKESEVTLAINESADFVFTIKVPKNTPPGAHYLGLSIEQKSDQSVSNKLATILTLQVAGTANESLRLGYFGFENKYFFNKNWEGLLLLKNIGNIDLNLTGQIILFGIDDQVIFSRGVNLGNEVFSQSVRQIKIDFSDNSSLVLPGKYKAQIKINYGLLDQQLIGEASFWYLPVWFLVAFLLLVVLLFVLVIVKFRKKKNVEL